jgi:ribosome-associated toxin RatA of RatAB toxin-antitoxin module
LAKIEKSIVIEAPVEKVFAFVTDFDNFLKASSPEIKMEILSRDESPQKVGDIIKVKVKIGDQMFEADMETTEFVKNKKHVVRQKGGAFKKMVLTDTFEPTDGGTKWTTIMEYELPYSLLGKLIDKLKVRKEIEKGSDHYVNKTKELIEKE